MLPSKPTNPQDRIRRILADLETVRENLLALSDDIWLSIDHNDNDSLEEAVQFKLSYNKKMADFDALAAELSALIQQQTSVRPEDDEQTGLDNREHNERIIIELNREEPHQLDEHFTFKRPYGFILDGQATKGVTTWRRLFELVCRQLQQRAPERFASLPQHPDFISNRGHPSFSRDPKQLRAAMLINDGIHAEINLSANSICDMIRRLLIFYEIPIEKLQLFLREDRDADQTHGL